MNERMKFLKNHSRSKFLKAVLATKEKFELQLGSGVFDDPALKSARSKSNLDRAQSARSRPPNSGNLIHFQDFGQFTPKATTPRVKLNIPLNNNNNAPPPAMNATGGFTVATLSNIGSLMNLDNVTSVDNLNIQSERVNRDAQKPKIRPATAAPKKAAVFKPTVPRKENTSSPPRASSPKRRLENLVSIMEMRKSQPGTPKTPKSGFLLKHMKLFTGAKSNKYDIILKSGYYYYEEDVNIKDNDGNSPLFYAARHGNLDICKFLTEKYAKVNEPCSEGNTPLHMAFASNNTMVLIDFLLTLTHSL